MFLYRWVRHQSIFVPRSVCILEAWGETYDYSSPDLNLAPAMKHQMRQKWFAIFATPHLVCFVYSHRHVLL